MNNAATDKGELLSLVKERNQAGCFFNSQTPITDAMIDDAEEYFKALSRGYNNADETIGSYVRYMLLEITMQ